MPRGLLDFARGSEFACAVDVDSTTIQSYRDLEAWQRGMELVEEVYKLSRVLPREERYGLSLQLRRASVGIPSNVAEGQRYGFGKTYLRYVYVALGCEAEIQTQLELIVRLNLAPPERVEPVMQFASRTGQVLQGLKRSMEKRIRTHGTPR